MSPISSARRNVNQFYRGKRVLVTGANGFIGSHLISRLVESGAVIAAVIGTSGHAERIASLQGQATLFEGDLSENAFAEHVLGESRPEIIFNAASSLNTTRSFDGADAILRNTYGIARAVVSAALQAGTEKLVQFGSIEEYGAGESPFEESDREEPFSPYSLGKVMGTHFALAVSRLTPLRVCVVRPAATYGPGQKGGMLIPNLIKAGKERKEFDMNLGEQLRDLLYVDDLVEGLLRAGMDARADGHILNLGSGRGTRVKEVATLVNEAMGNPLRINFGAEPYRPLDPLSFYMSTTKAKEILGWEPQVGLAKGIAKTVAAYATVAA